MLANVWMEMQKKSRRMITEYYSKVKTNLWDKNRSVSSMGEYGMQVKKKKSLVCLVTDFKSAAKHN